MQWPKASISKFSPGEKVNSIYFGVLLATNDCGGGEFGMGRVLRARAVTSIGYVLELKMVNSGPTPSFGFFKF